MATKRLAVYMDMALTAALHESENTLARTLLSIHTTIKSGAVDYEALATAFDTAAQQARIIHAINAIEADIVRRMSE